MATTLPTEVVRRARLVVPLGGVLFPRRMILRGTVQIVARLLVLAKTTNVGHVTPMASGESLH